jgi:hypothetical protein
MPDRIDNPQGNPQGPGKTANPGGAGSDREIQPKGDEGDFGGTVDKPGAPKPQTNRPDIGKQGGSSGVSNGS